MTQLITPSVAVALGVAALSLTACRQEPAVPAAETASQTASSSGAGGSEIARMARRFAPTELAVDLSHLSDTDRRVLTKLVEASKLIDALFLRQVWFGNEAMLLDLVRDESPEGRERLHYFLINKG